MIIGRAGKARGGNKYWFNLENLPEGDLKSVNFEGIFAWKELASEVLMETDLEKEAKLRAG